MKLSHLLSNMTPADIAAAVSFYDTCEDGQEYTVTEDMMRRLETLGLAHRLRRGNAYFQTDLLIESIDVLRYFRDLETTSFWDLRVNQ